MRSARSKQSSITFGYVLIACCFFCIQPIVIAEQFSSEKQPFFIEENSSTEVSEDASINNPYLNQFNSSISTGSISTRHNINLQLQAEQIAVLQQEVDELKAKLKIVSDTYLDKFAKLDQYINRANSLMQQQRGSDQRNPGFQTETNLLDKAVQLALVKEYDEAIAVFNELLIKYPAGTYSAQAHFWIGEVYRVNKKYTEAIASFEYIIRAFPDHWRSPSAYFRLAQISVELNRIKESRDYLQTLISQYPDTVSAINAEILYKDLETQQDLQ